MSTPQAHREEAPPGLRSTRYWKRIALIAGLTFFAAPLNVLLHELAHMLVLTLGGIPSQLWSLGGMTPIGFQWDFDSLRAAQEHYGTSVAPIVSGALAGPLFTLGVGFAGLAAYQRWHSLLAWALAYSAVGTRSVVNLLFLTPKVIDGSIRSSDEAIAAYFLGLPLWGLWWLLVVGVLCMALLIWALPRNERILMAVVGFIGSFAGFFTIEYLVNTYIFHLTTWDR
jgi:hypothetical protein